MFLHIKWAKKKRDANADSSGSLNTRRKINSGENAWNICLLRMDADRAAKTCGHLEYFAIFYIRSITQLKNVLLRVFWINPGYWVVILGLSMHLGQAKSGLRERVIEMCNPASLLPVPQSGYAVQAVSSGFNLPVSVSDANSYEMEC